MSGGGAVGMISCLQCFLSIAFARVVSPSPDGVLSLTMAAVLNAKVFNMMRILQAFDLLFSIIAPAAFHIRIFSALAPTIASFACERSALRPLPPVAAKVRRSEK